MPGSLQWIFFETTRRPYCEAEVDHLLFHSCIQAMIRFLLAFGCGKGRVSSLFVYFDLLQIMKLLFLLPPTRQTGLNEPTPAIARDIVCALLHIHFIAYFEQACLILDIVTFVSNSLNIYSEYREQYL